MSWTFPYRALCSTGWPRTPDSSASAVLSMGAVEVNHTQLCGGHVFVSLDHMLRSEVSGSKYNPVFDAWEL